MELLSRDELLSRWERSSDQIGEALYDADFDAALTAMIEEGTLLHEEYWDVQDALKGVLLGFIRPKEVYQFLVDRLKDGKKSLQIYQVMDAYILKKYAAAIRESYEQFNARSADEIVSPILTPEVVLKEPSKPGVVDLKGAISIDSQAPRPISLDTTAPPFSPAPVAAPVHPQAEVKLSSVPVSTMENTPSSTPAAPFMLHRKEEIAPVASSAAAHMQDRSTLSFGNFMASAGSIQSHTPQAPVSRARVEIPIVNFDASSPEERPPSTLFPKPLGVSNESSSISQAEIPISVKKYADTTPTIHYSDLKSPLEKK